MKTTLVKLTSEEQLSLVQAINRASFAPLLEKYQDHESNPANETLEALCEKYRRPNTTFFFIWRNDQAVGSARVLIEGHLGRIAPIALAPEVQGQGVGVEAMGLIERIYPDVTTWSLDTIKQEEGLVRFYEKLGYQKTGHEETINERMSIIYMEKHL